MTDINGEKHIISRKSDIGFKLGNHFYGNWYFVVDFENSDQHKRRREDIISRLTIELIPQERKALGL